MFYIVNYKVFSKLVYNNYKIIQGGIMAKLPEDRGEGWVEWILIAILTLMVLVTIFLLLQPALANLWRDAVESIQ